ncbi:hypothetical protein D9Q98_003148 [Chlorella vulgaris]|uniref:SCP domain-containing protein n=1 Tax=Chlorella vulgaris TaxID=3077 RepID=A0A9D4TTE7_CHLVU|nr:hypothetical protein D9Q98_003148 [Chlorella vulgaris]
MKARCVAFTLALLCGVACAEAGCPNFRAGVLALHNKFRRMHNTTGTVKRLVWDTALAAKAQAHADTCTWGHTGGAALQGNGESIMSSPPQVTFPFQGYDVCSYAAWALYQEVTNYNFDMTGTSLESDMPIGHLINILWADTTRLGCGFTRCPGSLGSYVVCWYGPGFYMTPRYQSQAVMRSKIPRSRCQRATGDNWCAACVGTRCTACYGRPQYGQEMAPFPIRYDAAYKRCVSACSPSKMPRRVARHWPKRTDLLHKQSMDARDDHTAADGVARLRETVLGAFRDIAAHPRWDRSRACIILSGGLDSSIVACLGKDILGFQSAFTVVTTPDSTDREHSVAVAAVAGLEHTLLDISLEDLLQELPDCVRLLQTFDGMELRNDIAVCRALREAAAAGFTCAVTGDAADELFGGYSFTHRLDAAAWEHNRQRMVDLMKFGSVPLGEHFGLFVTSPFTQPAVIQAAMQFNKADCVQPQPSSGGLGSGLVAGGTAPLLGKMPLRLAFPEVPTCWRGKDPIEVGCGTTELSDRPWLPQPAVGYFSSRISDDDFEQHQRAAEQQGVIIRDKEHLRYFQEFMRQFPCYEVPGKPRFGSDPCPACGWQLSSRDQTFCVTCGHYDAQLRSKERTVDGSCTDKKAAAITSA